MRTASHLAFTTLGLSMSQCGEVQSPGLGTECLYRGSGSASNLLSDLCQITSSFRAAVVSSVEWGHWTKWSPRLFQF